MTVTLNSHFFAVAFGVWYGIGFISLVFWSVVVSGYRKVYSNVVDKFFKTMWSALTLSLFGPVVFFFCLVMWAFFESLLNPKSWK